MQNSGSRHADVADPTARKRSRVARCRDSWGAPERPPHIEDLQIALEVAVEHREALADDHFSRSTPDHCNPFSPA